MTKWKIKNATTSKPCECGSRDEVIEYVHEDTRETRCLCVNCEAAAAAVRRVS